MKTLFSLNEPQIVIASDGVVSEKKCVLYPAACELVAWDLAAWEATFTAVLH
ncbi:MAG: hypothetical protein JSR37_09800 [Verrucomicrobia bacterium]|nr:hypothetical protein [Verrucomicrobiota bacterium]MBS0637861.1 hypothetical protein [Verrucomicrobiota bacterium]